ncbi:MAG: phage holin family protein [Blastocatellia bacterium]
MKILWRWACAAVAIYVAIRLVPGLEFAGPWWHLAMVALIQGFFNALLRPLLALLTCPLILLTLGLFTLVINACMLWLTAEAAASLGIQFRLAGFWPAFWGALLISIVSAGLNLLIREEEQRA